MSENLLINITKKSIPCLSDVIFLLYLYPFLFFACQTIEYYVMFSRELETSLSYYTSLSLSYYFSPAELIISSLSITDTFFALTAG